MRRRGARLAAAVGVGLVLVAASIKLLASPQAPPPPDAAGAAALDAEPPAGPGASEIAVVDERAFSGPTSIRASVAANAPSPVRFARAVWKETGWKEGDEISFGAAFYLPVGFKRAVGGYVALLRWDDFPGTDAGITYVGVVMWASDGRFRLVRERLRGRAAEGQVELAGEPFDVPEGRWFRLDVVQRLSRGEDGVNVVYLDGERVGEGRGRNHYGSAGRYARVGIVAVAESRQTEPLHLWFDAAYARRGRREHLK